MTKSILGYPLFLGFCQNYEIFTFLHFLFLSFVFVFFITTNKTHSKKQIKPNEKKKMLHWKIQRAVNTFMTYIYAKKTSNVLHLLNEL